MKNSKAVFNNDNGHSKVLGLLHTSITSYRNKVEKSIKVLSSMIKTVLQDEFDIMLEASDSEVPNLSKKTKMELERKYKSLKSDERFQQSFEGNKKILWLFKGIEYHQNLFCARLIISKAIFEDDDKNYSKLKGKTKSLVRDIQSCISELMSNYNKANMLLSLIKKLNSEIPPCSKNEGETSYINIIRKISIYDFSVRGLSMWTKEFKVAKKDIKDVYYYAETSHEAHNFKNNAVKRIESIEKEFIALVAEMEDRHNEKFKKKE